MHAKTGRGRGTIVDTLEDAESELQVFVDEDEHASFFCVIEGADGVGKSSLTQALTDALSKNAVLSTSEPNAGCVGYGYIRRFLTGEIALSVHAQRMAYALNRYAHVHEALIPFIEAFENGVILCDRYILSSLVYQTQGLWECNDVMEMNVGARLPDLVLLLRATPETCMDRLRARGGDSEIFDDQIELLLQKYDERAQWLREYGVMVVDIDANQPADRVLRDALYEIGRYAPLWVKLP